MCRRMTSLSWPVMASALIVCDELMATEVWDVKSNEDACSFFTDKLRKGTAEDIIPSVEALLDECISEDPKKAGAIELAFIHFPLASQTSGLGCDNMTCAGDSNASDLTT